jgi:hypothetical protein
MRFPRKSDRQAIKRKWEAQNPETKTLQLVGLGALVGLAIWIPFTYNAELRFFEATAQVIPVLLLALAIEGRVFRLSLRRDEDRSLTVLIPCLLAVGEIASLIPLATGKTCWTYLALVSPSITGGLAGIIAIAIYGAPADWPRLAFDIRLAIFPGKQQALAVRIFNTGERSVRITSIDFIAEGVLLWIPRSEAPGAQYDVPKLLQPGDALDAHFALDGLYEVIRDHGPPEVRAHDAAGRVYAARIPQSFIDEANEEPRHDSS